MAQTQNEKRQKMPQDYQQISRDCTTARLCTYIIRHNTVRWLVTYTHLCATISMKPSRCCSCFKPLGTWYIHSICNTHRSGWQLHCAKCWIMCADKWNVRNIRVRKTRALTQALTQLPRNTEINAGLDARLIVTSRLRWVADGVRTNAAVATSWTWRSRRRWRTSWWHWQTQEYRPVTTSTSAELHHQPAQIVTSHDKLLPQDRVGRFKSVWFKSLISIASAI